MKSIYFHLVGGAAGDMVLAALINLGCPLSHLKKEFKKLNIKFSVHEGQIRGRFHTPRKKLVFKGDRFTSYKDIVTLIKNSKLGKDIKNNVLRVYEKIINVERKVHKTRSLHCHHLGEIDAILEICGFFIALKYLNIEKIYVSSYPLAQPAPATLELLKAKRIHAVSCSYETVTPTAAALLMGAEQLKGEFSYKNYAVAWGQCGDEDFLVAYLFQEDDFDKDEVIKIETNIDDMNPQMFESLFEVLYNRGAKEVYLEAVLMKKMRPAYVLGVLCYSADFSLIREAIFKHTSTFGIRYQKYQRDKLKSKFEYKQTKFGRIRFRTSISGIKKQTPEYQDCKRVADKQKIPLIEVYRQLTRA
ncbi:MAG: LarC family nickel insertion protein [Candidatus Omnitrophota bacterium]|nr:MAG: LarC family nickel insertion protein [Candidatus Omnitrophota bacterium]